MAEEGNSIRAIIAAFAANLGIAVSKFVAFLFTGSSAMLAEAVHSVADTTNQLLLLLGGRRAKREASPLHPFGYQRFRYFYGFLVTLVIFLVGGVFALFEGYEKLHSPEPVESPVWAFAVLGVSIALESFSLRTAVHEAQPERRGLPWLRFIKTTRSPELPVVLAEDFGALTGLFFASVGITLAVVTGDGRWDAVGTIAIGALLVVISITLSMRMRSLLIGESADQETLRRIEAAVEPFVDRLIHLRTMHLGPDQLLIAAKVAFKPDETVAHAAEAINRAEARIREDLDDECLIFLEPDVWDQRLHETEAKPPGSAAPTAADPSAP